MDENETIVTDCLASGRDLILDRALSILLQFLFQFITFFLVYFFFLSCVSLV